MANILILNGAARKNGHTAALIRAFTAGAESAKNTVTEVYIQDKKIHSCTGCDACSRKPAGIENPCVQADDIAPIYPAFEKADVVVFASPVYYWTITGPLKTVADRLYAKLRNNGYGALLKRAYSL